MSRAATEVEKESKIEGYSFFRKKFVNGNKVESGNGNKSLDKITKKNGTNSLNRKNLESSEKQSTLKSNKSFSKINSNIPKNEKGEKYSNFTKTTETRIKNTNSKNGGKNETIKNTTKITKITTTSNSKDKRLPSGKKEVFKSITNIRAQSNQGNKSLILNQKASNNKSKSKGGNIIDQKFFSTLMASPSSTNKRRQIIPSQSTANFQKNYIGENNKKTNMKTNEKTLISQKSTPSLKGILNSQNKTNSKNEKKRTMSLISQDNGILNNISSIFIDETGKKPKKEYVLNERKTETIQIKNKVRMEYKNDPNAKEPISTDLNHTIKIVKDISKDPSTVKELPEGSNYSSHVINETRKSEVVKTEISGRQSHNNNDNFLQKKKLIPLPTKEPSSLNLREKNKSINNISNIYNTRTNVVHNSNSKLSNYTSATNRNRSETGNKKNPVGQSIKITTTKVTETRTSRGKSEDKDKKKGAIDKSKITITKTIEIKSGNRRNQLKITKSSNNTNESGKKEGKNKIQALSISQILSNEKDKKRNKSQSGNEGKNSKINVIKTTESSNAGKSTNDIKNKKFGKSNDVKNSKVKTDRSEKVTTKTTTKQTKNQPSEGNSVEGATIVKKFKSFRMQKKK